MLYFQEFQKINLWHDIWMEDSPLIDKISQDLISQITDTTKISYLNDNKRTWNNNKLNSMLPKYIVDKITKIPISIMICSINLSETYL